MNLYKNSLYMEDVYKVGSLELPWEKLRGKSFLISGATGLIGSFLVDVLMEKNISSDLGCTVYALTRNVEKAKERFSKYWDSKYLSFIVCDVNIPLVLDEIKTIDYALHLASNTHPIQYATDPIGTISANIIGLQNMLNAAVDYAASRFVFASSNEIYGENRGDVEFFDEDYCGYINSNTLRAGYPESKRCGEALCQAYIAQKNLNVVVARLTRSYGPTMLMSDTKAISQFIKKAISGDNIVLKSAGNQFYSFLYVADSVSGLLTVMLKGEMGKAYNIADEGNDITLKDLANLIADTCGTKVVFEIPDSLEASGYSTATKARLSGNKIKRLGWKPEKTILTGIIRTLKIMKETTNNDSITK